MGCDFCATGTMGFRQNLDAGEIAGQVLMMEQIAQERFGRGVSNVVFMGMGEPLLNYDAVQKAIGTLTHKDGLGLGAKRITVSTVGLARRIRDLADAGVRHGLAVSLHAPFDAKRSAIMPVNRREATDLAALRRALTALGPDRMVVVLTLHGPFSRVERDNADLREAVAGYRNVALADWDAALADTSGMLQSDGIHPSIRGAHVYARVVQQAFARLSEQHTGTKVTLRTLPMP